MNQTLRTVLLGLLIWAFPFVLGFFFYDATGNLIADIFLFKSVMLLTITFTTVFSIRIATRMTTENFFKQGLIFGLLWLTIPLLLDVLILIPMAAMTTTEYLFQIGLRYLIIPIITVSTGLLLEQKLTIKN